MKLKSILCLSVILFFINLTAIDLTSAADAAGEGDFLLDIANRTYSYFLIADSNSNGFLDGWYEPLVKADGLVFSIGKYDGSWAEFDEYSPVDYYYNIDAELPNKFPLVLNDNPASRAVYINFTITADERSRELTLFLNAMNWGGAANKVQLYLNNNLLGQFSLGGASTQKSFNFSANTFLEGKNTFKVYMICTYCSAWFAWESIQLGETSKITSWRRQGIGEGFDDKASPEEAGFYMLSHIGAYELGLINISTAQNRITDDLSALKNKPKSNGLFYRYYKTHKNEVIDATLPSVGNAMLAASLITVKNWALEKGLTAMASESSAILDGINLTYFWDGSASLFYHDSSKTGYWDFYSDEGRLLSFVAFALGRISYGDFESNLGALDKTTLYYDISTGNIVSIPTALEDIKVDMASWDGSMFTYLVPSLFIQEHKTSYLKNTSGPAVKAQIEYSKNMGYGLNSSYVWGISDAFNASLYYCWAYEGAPPAKGFLYGNPYEVCKGLITPHASALALLTDYSDEAVSNLHILANNKSLYTDYGFKDSVNVVNGDITNRILTLDQEWIFLSLMNRLNGTIWKYFYKEPGVIKAHHVMYKEDFVKVDGTNFMLDGKPYYAAGANAYFLWYGDLDCIGVQPNQGCVIPLLNDAKSLNLTYIRTWGFCNGAYNYGYCFQPSAGVYNENAFIHFDQVLKEASDRKLRLVVTFVNNWDDFGGMNMYNYWCNVSEHDKFYTNNCTKKLYKDYVRHFINRTNTITGIKYRDEPAIFAWELANEPRARTNKTGAVLNSWIGEMSAYIKSIDQNHLVSTGIDGGYVNKGDNPWAWWYKGNEGQDYIANHQWSTVDFATFHYFPHMDPAINASRWIEEHIYDAHSILNKPVMFEEFNVQSDRNTTFIKWYKQMQEQGVNADSLWMLADNYIAANNDGYFVFCPEDAQVCSIIKNHAGYMHNLTNPAPKYYPKERVFYESFDNNASISANNGTIYGTVKFLKGISGNSLNMTNNGKVCYPLKGNFNNTNGTIEFWIKPSNANPVGFFDIGNLGNPNSWGIFKNDYAIMEVKNYLNQFDQGWSPQQLVYDSSWHFIAAAWEKKGAVTSFKIMLDGKVKGSYDGNTADTNPDLTKNFCIGWNSYYSYSKSAFDEFKIFNYAKSDAELRYDYYSVINRTKQKCIMHKPQSKGAVKINCSGLYVNNQPYYAKGVGYQPIPVGMTADIPGGADVVFNTPGIYNRDFPLLKKMNANTIKTWARVTNRSFLDAAHEKGLKVVMGFWISCNENYGDPTVIQNYKNSFSSYVAQFKDHPAVLMWALGNENNLEYCTPNTAYIDDFYKLGNELAKIAYQTEGQNYHPVGIINGDLGYIGNGAYFANDSLLNYTDYWALNAYPGKGFKSFLDEYSYLSGKPLYISEYGIDALNNTNKAEYGNVQAEWDVALWKDISAANFTIGAALMAYSDEWWKAGSPSSHDYGGYPTYNHPDGYSNEEWWGIVRIADNGNLPDAIEPREAYYAFQKAFAENISYNVNLTKGWNLISFPLNLTNKTISNIFKNITYAYIYTYENNSYALLNNNSEIKLQNGYWVKANKNETLTLTGTLINKLTYNLNSSYNLISYPGINEKNISYVFGNVNSSVDNILAFDNKGKTWASFRYNKQHVLNSISSMQPGQGYLIILNRDANWSFDGRFS